MEVLRSSSVSIANYFKIIVISATLLSMDIGMQIIHFKKFSVPVSTGTSKVDKVLKMPSNSISKGIIFQNFLGGMLPDPPRVAMLCMPVCFPHYKCKYVN